jgi:opacity protein-like surface antigen
MRKLYVIAMVVAMVALVSVSANASNGLRSIGVGAGYVTPDNLDGTWTVGLNFDFGLPVNNLFLQPFAGYWSYSLDVSGFGIDASSSISDWQFGANAKYAFVTSAANMHPYVQGGAAIHLLTMDVSTDVGGFPLSLSTSETKFGVQGGAGLAYDVAERWALYGEGNYFLVSDFNQWSVGAGVRVNL